MRPILRLERIVFLICLALGGALAGRPALATPWAEVGDAQLRSDIEVLAAAGLIDDVTTQWPLPWGGLLSRLEKSDSLGLEPDYVRAAAGRVEAAGRSAIAAGRVNYAIMGDLTNLPDVVRGFDALGREDAQ